MNKLDHCKVIGLFTLCPDTLYSEFNCTSKKGLHRLCWDCQSHCHVSAMCPGLDKSTLKTNIFYQDDNGGSNLLLPVMEVVTIYEGVEYRFKVLINSTKHLEL